MQLLTEELRASLPPLRSQKQNNDPHVYAKFFTPDSNWTWFVLEGSAEDEDFIFYGYVFSDYDELELGYFSLKELESVRGGLRLPIERDRLFKPGSWSGVRARYKQERGEQV